MTGPRCAELRQSLGVYVLGAIDPAERSDVDAHLAGCPACRDELAGLASLPALLSRVSEDQLEDAAGSAGGALLARILTEMAARRRHARRRTLLAAAAAVFTAVVLAAGGAWSLLGGASGPPVPSASAPAPAQSYFASDPQSRVSAAVAIVPKAWGTAVTAQLSGLPGHTSCKLVAVSQDGARDTAASWYVGYKEKATFRGSTAVQRDDLVRFEVVSDQGKRLLVIPVH